MVGSESCNGQLNDRKTCLAALGCQAYGFWMGLTHNARQLQEEDEFNDEAVCIFSWS